MSDAERTSSSAEEEEEDDDGVDISAERRTGKGRQAAGDDSSEEEEDDEEEARRIADGFIVEGDEDEESEDGDDAEETSSQRRARRKKEKREKKKRKRRHASEAHSSGNSDALSEDDLDLLAENTGAFVRPSKAAAPKKASKKKLLRRKRSDLSGSDDSGAGEASDDDESGGEREKDLDASDLKRIFDDRPRRGDEDEDDDDEDDLADFIEEDEREGEDEEEKRERKRQEKERRRKKKQGGKGRKEGDGGISKSTWDDIYDVFGNGDEYDWALEGEDEMFGAAGDGEAPKISDIFEPAEIKARFLTEEDDLIRARDIPERHQLLNSTLSTNPTYIPEPFPAFPPVESAAVWIAPRISSRTRTFLAPKLESYPGADIQPAEEDLHRRFVEAVQRVLNYLFVEHLEVPFIWEHRRDYIVFYRKDEQGNAPSATDSGSGLVRLLERNELWKVYELGTKYRSLMRRKEALDATWAKLSERKMAARLADQDVTLDNNGAEILPTGESSSAKDAFETYYAEKIDGSGGLAEEGVEGVMDAMEWVGLRWGRELREMREEEDEEMRARGERRQKRTNEGAIKRAAELREGRAGTALRNMGITPEEAIAKNLFQPPTITQEDPDMPPDEWAEAYVDNRQFSSTEAVLKGMRTLQVADLATNPTLRQIVRQSYREQGLLTIRPTEKGLTKIDEFHPYFSFKYLKDKPVAELAQSARFLHYLEAEKDTLVSIRFFLPQQVRDRLERGVIEAFTSAGDGEVPNAWNAWREHNIKLAIRNELLPMGERWVKEWLRDEVEDFVAGSCGELLEKAANQAPYRPKEYEKGTSPSVMAVSHGRGDFKHDAVMCVFIDEQGRIRETIKVDHLRDKQFEIDRGFFTPESGKEHPTDTFKAFVQKRQPGCIVVGGFTVATHDRVYNRVRAIVGELAEEKVNNQPRDEQVSNGWGAAGPTNPEERERELAEATLPVIYVPDAAARLYQHSERAKKEFPAMPQNARYCVGLGRYVQSPIHEYCAMRADITAITVDDDSQKLVPIEKLYVAFERALVNVVNDVGVMINDTVTDAYQQNVLPFVAGLGPRKATKLVRDIIKNTSNGALINRNELLTAELLGSVVCENVIASIEIAHDPEELELTGDDIEGQPDPLDSTRIHPEDYEFARKMAENALELDEDDVADDHPSKSVVKLMLDDSPEEKLNELNLDDFADNLRELRHVEKRYALHVIKDEIAIPGRDRRDDFRLPTDWEVLTMLSGETPRTLLPGFIIAGHIWRVRDKDVNVRLDSGVEAMVDIRYVADHEVQSCNQVARIGSVQAMIIGVFPEKMLVELSMRKTELDMGDAEQRRVRAEEPYDWEQAHNDKAARDKKKRTEVNRMRRQIDHPNFFNMNAAQAEQYLATQQRGDCVIRPSSLGIDHLAVTWKVDDGVYQHLDVNELDKPNPQSVGQILRVANKYTYHDLDELIVSHIKATVRKIDELMNHDKFKGRSQDELHSFLKNYTMANPGKSIYGFGLNRERPGYFDLAFLSKPTTEGGVIQTWPVKVNPGSYVLGEAEVGGMLELCNSFKTQYAERLRQSQAAAGGRTPYGRPTGGGAPATEPLRSGATPARTPGGRMLDPRTGATPNPYGVYQQPQPMAAPQQQAMGAGGYDGAYAAQAAYAYGAAAGYGQPGPSSAAVGYGGVPQAPTGYGGQPAGGYGGLPAGTAGGYGAPPAGGSYGYGQHQPSQAGPSSYGQPPARPAQPMAPPQSMAAMPGINPQRAAMLAAAGPDPAGYAASPPVAPPPMAAGSGANSGTDAGWGARSQRPAQQQQSQQGGW